MELESAVGDGLETEEDGVEREFVNKAGDLDASVSLVWGIWHLISVYNVKEERVSCPVGLTAEAFVELLEPVQLGAVLSEHPEGPRCCLFWVSFPPWKLERNGSNQP